jgi:GTP-binding protein EngB required for normal cell division
MYGPLLKKDIFKEMVTEFICAMHNFLIAGKMSSMKFTESISRTKEYDLQYKVIVIGETAVGKSSLIRRYANPDQPFSTNMISTVGM